MNVEENCTSREHTHLRISAKVWYYCSVMTLLIVESPAKAKTISKYLGKGYEVVASVGHIRDLPKSNKKAVDIKNGFTPHYEVVKGKEHVVAEIERRAKKSDKVFLATDPDREGEAIAWHVVEACHLAKTKVSRVVFHEITKEAVEEALEHPRAIDENLKEAQEARRVLDRLVGYDLSGLIWKKLRYGLSAGRVQSPALRILAEREREIRAFIPEAYWTITAHLTPRSGATLPFVCEEEPRDEKEADRIIEAGRAHPWSVVDVTQTHVARAPKAPFTTSTLQQAASSRLGLSPSNTMRIAQKLYEAGLITYMRTDSTTLSAQVLPQIAGVIESSFGKNLVSIRQYKTKSKNAQEAHEAIRPSHASDRNAGRTPEEKKLYNLIWQRTIASQMQDATLLRTKITAVPIIRQLAEQVPNFALNGNVVIAPGWLLADPAARGEENELPRLKKGDALTLARIEKEGKETQPPNRYSEAGLIKELEKRGIGRPSTYASIIKTLLDREYVNKESRSLKPTDLGELVSSFLEEHFGSYISDTFTAEMEDELDDIALGKRSYEKTLKDFYGPFSKDVASKKDVAKINDLGDAPVQFHCPTCSGPMKIKLGKSGKFYSCARFPDCAGALTLEGKEIEGPKKTGEKCPECANGELVERDGRYGRFISCSNYPKCKYIKRDASTSLGASTGVECPLCKAGLPAGQAGTMTEKRGRYGVFYGCSNYPKCKNITKTKPTGALCSLCGSLMMEGTKTIPVRCSNKACVNHNPHKLKVEEKKP